MADNKIGEVVSASVLGGLEIKLDLPNPEELRIGYPVMVEGERYDFYSMVSDIINQRVDMAERLAGSRFRGSVVEATGLHEGYSGRVFYSKAQVRPIKMIDRDGRLLEPDTIPPYFSTTRLANLRDVEKLYVPKPASAVIGTLRGVEEFPVNLDFERLTEKPFAVFGRTGVGKSILNKLVCLGIIGTGTASVMIFDMHGEYGVYSKSDSTEGLKYHCPKEVELFSLDPDDREARPFLISPSEIKPDDVIVAFQDLSDQMIDALYAIDRRRPRDQDLISAIEAMDPESVDESIAHPSSLAALQRRMARLRRFSFVREGERDSFREMSQMIADKRSIVLDFGGYGTDTMAYLFIANVVSRRLFKLYTESGRDYPRLVLFLEEAHKFLSPGIAEHTIFSKLARETRKFNLILALIDQRPSKIDDEVRSQLANRMVMSLKEPSDVTSSLAGVPDRADWEKIVATIPQRAAMVIGDAIPIPTVISVLDYNVDNVRSNLLCGREGMGRAELDRLESDATKILD